MDAIKKEEVMEVGNSLQPLRNELLQGDDVVVDLYKMENRMDSSIGHDDDEGKETKDTKETDETSANDSSLVDSSIPFTNEPFQVSYTKQDEEDSNPIPTPASAAPSTSSSLFTPTSPLILSATAKFSTWDLLVQPTNTTHSTNNQEKGEEENDRINPTCQTESSASIFKRPFSLDLSEDCPLILTQTKRFAVFSIKEEEEKGIEGEE